MPTDRSRNEDESGLTGDDAVVSSEAAGRDRLLTLILTLSGLLSLGLIGALLAVDYLPTHDGPQHVFLGFLERHIGDAGRGWDGVFERAPQATSMGFTVLFSAFEAAMSWRAALSASLIVIAMVWAWAFMALCTAAHHKRAMLGVLGFACTLQWALYMGFFSFVLSTAVGFAALALALAEQRWTPVRRLAIGALVTIQAVAHLFPAQQVGLMLLLLVAFRKAPAKTKLREVALLTLMGLPALLITALVLSARTTPIAASQWLPIADRVRLFGATFVSGPVWRAWAPVLLATGGIGLTVRAYFKGSARRDDMAMATFSAGSFLAVLVCPLDLKDWEFFSPRLLPLGTMMGICALPVERLELPKRRAMLVGAAVLGALSLLWARGYHRELGERCSAALAGLDVPLIRSGPRLVAVLDPFAGPPAGVYESAWRSATVPFVTPLWNLGKLYAVAHGGVTPMTFTSRPRLLPFVMSQEARRAFPQVPDPIEMYDPRILNNPASRRALMDWLGEMGTRFEDFVLYGSPADGDVLVERGYAVDFRKGGLMLGHFEGCPVEIVIPTKVPFEAPLVIQYSWDRRRPPVTEFMIPPGAPTKDGGYAVSPRASLCGRMFYRVALDLDGSNTPTARDRHCADAGPTGFIAVDASRAKGPLRLECVLKNR